MVPHLVPEIEGGYPERDIGAEEEEEGQGWGDSRRLMQILYARAYTNDPRSYIVVFSAPLPPNVEQHLSGEQQHDHLPRAHRHHLPVDGTFPCE